MLCYVSYFAFVANQVYTNFSPSTSTSSFIITPRLSHFATPKKKLLRPSTYASISKDTSNNHPPNHGQPPHNRTTAAPNAPPNNAGAAPLGVVVALVPLAAAEAEPEAPDPEAAEPEAAADPEADPEAEMSAAVLEGRKGAGAGAEPVGVRDAARGG
ncbi:hypothetical protein B0H16DRAFT_1690606 [Mycena metata]|uniref:Uncharacterized protein n=1 Tax=Mycena metata TaxID=1033252 RepID=A0AAD7J079_9AGAR|nr:hypothetical protein B0H16DRAFT_1690606 [Mycena metata]